MDYTLFCCVCVVLAEGGGVMPWVEVSEVSPLFEGFDKVSVSVKCYSSEAVDVIFHLRRNGGDGVRAGRVSPFDPGSRGEAQLLGLVATRLARYDISEKEVVAALKAVREGRLDCWAKQVLRGVLAEHMADRSRSVEEESEQ
ncbi:hypothetical protein [Schaalia sp. lx-260]|uniref:hypothetical protein n=1 Tax=Schaalia sp. lx-260 TaxID=2899082 RepID=UPI001E4CD384|nr:hypothetical protein [Schaalia sp. lx-260]MCD4549696.1 hypothetical protein [Schaalia sp. lx-260]